MEKVTIVFLYLVMCAVTIKAQDPYPIKSIMDTSVVYHNKQSKLTIDTTFYSDGKIMILTRKNDNKKEDKQEWFFQNGKFWKIYYYKNDSLSGPWIEYFESTGFVKIYGFYKNNIPTGEWVYYYESYKVKSKGSVCDEEIIGPLDYSVPGKITLFVKDANGNLKQEINFTQSTMDSLKKELGSADGKALLFPFVRNVKDGTWKYFNENGKLIRLETYECGVLKNTVNY